MTSHDPPPPGGEIDAEREAGLRDGRRSYASRAWEQAWRALSRADARAPLEVADLERLQRAAALSGRGSEHEAASERLYRLHDRADRPEAAARVAFWIGMRCLAAGDVGQGGAWLSRAHRLVEDRDCVEGGYLLLPAIHRHAAAGDLGGAAVCGEQAVVIARRFGDPDLDAFATNLLGRVRVQQGEVAQGLALWDTSMLAAAGGELTPLVTGLVYCNVIAGCQEIQALDRSREWTAALSAWCDEQAELVMFTATCRVHRCEVLQLQGDWPGALAEADRIVAATDRGADRGALGHAHYQRGELHRLRGAWDDAERDYRAASAHGREPQPGLALLRHAQGQSAAACAALRRVHAACSDPLVRLRSLPACIEILVSTGDLDAAELACIELESIAERYGTDELGAHADHARGVLRLARGDAQGALASVQSAAAVWRRVGAPYLDARVRVVLGRVCEALGDRDGAQLEWQAAEDVFAGLGAAPDLAAVRALTRPPPVDDRHGLTVRELEVLRLVARGITNREIAALLHRSEKTVDRHVSSILAKLGVPSRAAATAFAYEHALV